eukprot:CAMPEP_0167768550 /NCGR_PEP_ID=MMETSP0110_2-20121227/16736_1 /TAXON_ID=629695 /ORGANISM="Gymnochlora sp., Strain CCMP2014" /LENGTH=1288 /DNA_ID=CAMNT_0007657249 /DNA_START=12 /DNA_END=3878 /DNA_ORIENTATION=-
MCGAPKPPPQPKKKKATASSSEGPQTVIHDSMVLTNAMHYLSLPGEPPSLEQWPSVGQLVEAAWRSVKLDNMEKRVILIENIPVILSEKPSQVQEKVASKKADISQEQKTEEENESSGPETKKEAGKLDENNEGTSGGKKSESEEVKAETVQISKSKTEHTKKTLYVDPDSLVRDSLIDMIKGVDPSLRVQADDIFLVEDASKPKFVPPKVIEDKIPVLDFPRVIKPSTPTAPFMWESTGIFYHLGCEVAEKEDERLAEEKKAKQKDMESKNIGKQQLKEEEDDKEKTKGATEQKQEQQTKIKAKVEGEKTEKIVTDKAKIEDTKNRKRRYMSPSLGKKPAVRITSSAYAAGSPSTHNMLSRALISCWCGTDINSQLWVTFELLNNRRCVPTGYSFLTIMQCYPTCWKFQASNDRKEWIDLHEGRNPVLQAVKDNTLETIPGKSTNTNSNQNQSSFFFGQKQKQNMPTSVPAGSARTMYFPVTSPEGRGYNYFRFFVTKRSSNNTSNLALCGFEVYGELGGPSLGVIPDPLPTNRVAMFILPTTYKQSGDSIIDQLAGETLDQKDIPRASPRRIELFAHWLHTWENGKEALLRQFLRWRLLKSSENSNKCIVAGARLALTGLEISHKEEIDEGKATICSLVQGIEDGIMKAQLAKISTMKTKHDIAEFIANMIISESKQGDPLKVLRFLRGIGLNLNFEPQNALTVNLATTSQRRFRGVGHAAAFVSQLQTAAIAIGESNLLHLAPSQLNNLTLLTIADKLTGQGSEGRESKLDDNETWECVTSLRLRFEVLKLFNALFAKLYPVLHNEIPANAEETSSSLSSRSHRFSKKGISTDVKKSRSKDSIKPVGMASLMRASRGLLFDAVKRAIERSLLDETAEKPANGRPSFVLNRVALRRRAEDTGTSGDFSTNSQYAAAYRQLKDVSPHDLRPIRPGGTEPFVAFEVKTEGENVVGLAGPYRQFFTEIANELMSEESPLLIPTPNRKYGTGDFRERFLFDPGAQSHQMLSMFDFLGRLFGVAIRTGTKIPLALAPLTWKVLVGEEVSLSDLKRVDTYAASALIGLRSLGDDFKGALPVEDQAFTVMLSDGSVHELKPKGEGITVTASNKGEYVALASHARLSEQDAQVNAVRKGLGSIIPIQLLNLMTWQDLELRVCGVNTVDVNILKRHTKYSGVSPTEKHIGFFWEMLEDFTQEQRRSFVRFCWAQERLPANDAEFKRTKTRFQIKASIRQGDPDKMLPSADTCFFNLTLPKYSTKEIMTKKVLYAVEQVTTMDKDEGMEDDGVAEE